MFINFSLLKSHRKIICCLCRLSILVLLLVLVAWFSFSKLPISILSLCVQIKLAPVMAAEWSRLAKTPHPSGYPWLVQGGGMWPHPDQWDSIPGLLLELLRKRCVFLAGAAKLVAYKAGVSRGCREGESTWELVRVSQYRGKQTKGWRERNSCWHCLRSWIELCLIVI